MLDRVDRGPESMWTGSMWTGSMWTGSMWTGAGWTTGEYDDFLTAFWGNQPPAWKHLAGESPDTSPGCRNPQQPCR